MSVDYSAHMHRIVFMQVDRPFLALTPTVDGDVLQILSGAEAAFTPGEVQRLLGRHSVAGVRLALNRLVEQGIVSAAPAGRAVMYRLNRDHVLAGAIVEISQAKAKVIARLQGEFSQWKLPCSYAALFGSSATGSMTVGSDIDVFIVRPDRVDAGDDGWRRQRDELAARCSAWTGNDCQILELSEADLQGDPAVLSDIAESGIHLAGPARFLKAS